MDYEFPNWREMIGEALAECQESWDDVISNTLTDDEMDRRFDNGFGGTEGTPFTVWTTKRVYFPTEYDGAEGVDSVSRNPDGIPTGHI